MDPMNAAERDLGAVAYLKKTRAALIDSPRGLSEAQWRYKPDEWSIAECVEHLRSQDLSNLRSWLSHRKNCGWNWLSTTSQKSSMLLAPVLSGWSGTRE